MRISELTTPERRELELAVADKFFDGWTLKSIEKHFGLTHAQVRYIRLRLSRGQIETDWKRIGVTFSVDYAPIDESVAKNHVKTYCGDKIDWANVSIGPCLGVW